MDAAYCGNFASLSPKWYFSGNRNTLGCYAGWPSESPSIGGGGVVDKYLSVLLSRQLT